MGRIAEVLLPFTPLFCLYFFPSHEQRVANSSRSGNCGLTAIGLATYSSYCETAVSQHQCERTTFRRNDIMACRSQGHVIGTNGCISVTGVSRNQAHQNALGKGKALSGLAGFPQLGNRDQVVPQQAWEDGL